MFMNVCIYMYVCMYEFLYVTMPECIIYTYMYAPMYLCVSMYVRRPVYSVCMYVRTYGCMNATMDVLLNTIFQHKFEPTAPGRLKVHPYAEAPSQDRPFPPLSLYGYRLVIG